MGRRATSPARSTCPTTTSARCPEGLDPARPVAVICASGQRARRRRQPAAALRRAARCSTWSTAASARGAAPGWPGRALASATHGRPPPARPLRPARRVAAPGRRARLRRGRALPPHVHDAAALLGRDAAARARAVARGDELEPAPAGARHRASPTSARSCTRCGACRPTIWQATRDRHGPGGGGVRARRASAGSRTGSRSRRPRAGAAGSTTATGTLAVLLASHARTSTTLIPTLVAYQLEWNKLHALLRAAEPARATPEPADVRRGVRRRRGGLDAHARGLARRARRRSSTRSATRRLNLRIRMLGGSQAGYARHDAPLVGAGARDAGRPGARRTARSTSSPPTPHSLVNLRHGDGAARARTRSSRFVEAHGPGLPARGARALPRGPRRGLVGELPLLRRAAVLRGASPRTAPAWERAAHGTSARVGVTHLSSRTGAARVRAGDGARPSSTRPGSTRGSAPIDAEQLARSPTA